MSNRLPRNLAQILRARGLKVVEVDGWYERDTGSSSFTTKGGVLCHHDAMSKRTLLRTVLNLLIRGRSDLRGPLAHISLGRDGTVYLIASGRAHHAGKARSTGSMGSGDGNSMYIGIEAQNDGVGEPYPKAQYDAYVRLCAALCVDVTGNSEQSVRAHKESSITGKIDPLFPMGPFRASVAKLIAVFKAGTTGDAPDTSKEGPVALNPVQKARVAIAEAISETNRAVALLKSVDEKRLVARAQITALQTLSGGLKTSLRLLPPA